MADEAFDKQARWAELQIKATEVLGKYARDIAEARKTDAQALAEEIKDKALESLEKQLDRDLSLLNHHRRQIELKQEALARDWDNIIPLQTGYKLYDLPTLHVLHEALSRIFAALDTSTVIAFMSAPITNEAKTKENFVVVGKKATLQEVPNEITNVGSLLDWTKEQGLFFKKSRPAHLLILKSFADLGTALATKIDNLEKALAQASANDWKSVEQVKNAMEFKTTERFDRQ